MPPKTKPSNGTGTTLMEDHDLAAELIQALHKLVDVQADLLQQQKERDELIYRFLFIGEPDKKIPPFVTEVRATMGEHTAWIDGFKTAASRIIWLVAGVVITSGVGAILVWRFVIPPTTP